MEAHTRTHIERHGRPTYPPRAGSLLTQEVLTFVDFVALSVHLGFQDVAFNQALHDILRGGRDEEASKW